VASAFIAGCAGTTGGEPSPPHASAAIRAKAARAVEHAALRAIGDVHDRNLPGPKRMRARCKGPVAGPLRCTATAYTRPVSIADSPHAPFSVEVAGERWRVPLRHGRIGKPRQVDSTIGGFLESDDHFNCSGGESLNC
jgi:hypothetical protein